MSALKVNNLYRYFGALQTLRQDLQPGDSFRVVYQEKYQDDERVASGDILAAEFVNMYLGTGGEFFASGSAELAIDNDNGRKVLETMRAMTAFMNPDYLTYDANELNKVWDAGNVAFMQQWGSLAGATIDPATANPEVAANTGFAAAPTIGGGTTPAAALWWDGFTIAQNISDEDAW